MLIRYAHKCHYYAQIASSITVMFHYEKHKNKLKNHRRQVYVDYKQPEEAADNVVELELLEAMFC